MQANTLFLDLLGHVQGATLCAGSPSPELLSQLVLTHKMSGKVSSTWVESRVAYTTVTEDSMIKLTWQALNDAEFKLAFFQAVTEAINASLILEDIFTALSDVLSQFIPFQQACVFILDASQNNINVSALLSPEVGATVLNTGSVFIGPYPFIVSLLEAPKALYSETGFDYEGFYQRPSLLIPLIQKGSCLGGILVIIQEDQDPQEQLTLLSMVSDPIAVAIENARLYWQTQNQAGREFLINQITKAIRRSLNIEDILNTTAMEIGKVLGVSRCELFYQPAVFAPCQHYEYVLPGLEGLADPLNVAQFEQDLFLERADQESRFNPFIINDTETFSLEYSEWIKESGIKSLAIFPVLLRDTQLVGTLTLHQCDFHRTWQDEEIQLLKAIAEHVAVALHQARLFEDRDKQKRQLEQALKELQQAQIHLVQSEKMAVLGQFVAGIAHEVNTPVGTLSGNHQTILSCLDKLKPEEETLNRFYHSAKQLIHVNELALDRIQEIVKNLRNFARLDESDMKSVHIHEGLESTLLLLETSLRDRIVIRKQFGELPEVLCFPGLLNQVFMNLLVNASQAIEGHGEILLTTAYDAVTDQVTVSIGDSGKGIPPEHLNRIFDPGFTTKGVGVGTGLGLALCYKIIEKHQGAIHVDSVLDQGTMIQVTFPRQLRHARP
jgi:signal transduction histidine kinase